MSIHKRSQNTRSPFLTLLTFLILLTFPGLSVAQKNAAEASVKSLSPAEGVSEAQKLLAQIHAQRPDQTFTNVLLKIRGRDSDERKVLVRFAADSTPSTWAVTYTVSPASPEKPTGITKATIIHTPSAPNQYVVWESANSASKTISPDNTDVPFAGSDFFLGDLGLEFLHWPDQRVIKKEMHSSRYCAVLESINPNPARGGIARVRSWVTTEPPLAPVRAEAYDTSGKRIKVFDVKGIEKVNGHFQVDAVEMRNLKTGSRTVMEFDYGGQ